MRDHSHVAMGPDAEVLRHRHSEKNAAGHTHADYLPAQDWEGPEALSGALADWWMQTAGADLDKTVPKMEEYGSGDLEAIGEDLAKMAGWEGLTGAQKTELGIAFYIRGKVARLISAYERKELPSDDTWFDITVYSMMARAARERGGWGDAS